jgi:polyisoprenoid-binding protein YceI
MRALLVLALFCIGCSSVQRASVGPEVSASSLAEPRGEKLAIDRSRSLVEVAGADRVTGEHVAVIRSTDIWLVAPSTKKLEELTVVADLGSLSMEDPEIEAFVKSPDFLDIARYPTARFHSTSVSPLGENLHRVRGVLELHGVARAIEFVASVSRTRSELAVEANFRLPRRAFRIQKEGGWDFVIASEFRVRVRIIALLRPRPRATSRLSDRSWDRTR